MKVERRLSSEPEAFEGQPEMIRRRSLLVGLTSSMAMLRSISLAQEQYPNRPVRLLVPSAPGGVHDVIARFWGDAVKDLLGTVVIDNRGGAAGAIGVTEAGRAQADGYTLLLGSNSTHILQPLTGANPSFDPLRDFVVICLFATTATAVAVHPDLPAKTLRQLIEYIRATPGKLAYAHAGVGAISHVTGEMFKSLAGTSDVSPIPYRGMGPAQTDVISGKVPIFFPNITGPVIELHQAGRIRLLAVNAKARHESLPDVPTALEAGLPEMIAESFFGIFAPAHVPDPVIRRLNEVTFLAIGNAGVRQKLTAAGFEPLPPMSSKEATEYFRSEYKRWEPVIRAISASTAKDPSPIGR